MNRKRRKVLEGVSTLAVVAVAAVSIAGGGGGIRITRSSMDGGGVMRATGGGFVLSGTIGQPDAGYLRGGGFALSGGFWFRLAPGDHNDDGLVNLIDYRAFEACNTGPAPASLPSGCEAFDADQSGAVDLLDFAIVQTTFTGS